MSSRRTLARVGALVAGTATALSLAALPASAEGAKADIVSGGGDSGHNVNLGQGSRNMQTTLFTLNIEGGNTLRAYCVEISVSVDPKRSMFESPWDEFPNPDSPFHANRAHINWVLHHGFPVKDLAELEQTLTEQGVELHNGLDKKEAIAGTQAAVWHYSDGKDIDRDDPSSARDAGSDADVLALYDYLTGESNVGIEEPAPALKVSPETVSGEAGDRLGPFTVATTGEINEISAELPEGVTLTDADGNALAAGDITDGTEIYVDVPAEAEAGSGAFSLNATAHLATGRLFVSEGYQRKPAQSLIVASSEDTKLSAGATVEWAPAAQPTQPEETTETPVPSETSEAPAPTETTEPSVKPQAGSEDLAQTGASPMLPLLIGLGLVGAGTGAILLQRKKKNA
jgi:TQXA domain-containing protein/LPXTG-motif cell wall-anchored protein